jgi:hypothetical protein
VRGPVSVEHDVAAGQVGSSRSAEAERTAKLLGYLVDLGNHQS